MAVERVVHRSPDLGPGVGPKDKGCERSIWVPGKLNLNTHVMCILLRLENPTT